MTPTRLIKPLLLCVLLLITLTSTFAQEAEPTPAPQPVPSPSPTPASKPRVAGIEGNLELDDTIGVTIHRLEEWAAENDANKLVPYINGRAIKGNYPEQVHLTRGHLIFHLEITPESKDAWMDLLGDPKQLRLPVSFSVGLENGSGFDSEHEDVTQRPVFLTVISPVYGVVALIVILITLILLLWLARKTNIIREPGPPPAAGKQRPYNLGRAQMAFWFFLIYASYLTIWLITSALDTITSSLLALMGISAGTALGEAIIDTGKDTAQTSQLQELTAEKEALEQNVAQTQAQVDAINASSSTTQSDQINLDALNKQLLESRTRIGQIDQQVRALNSQATPNVSAGFLRDILSDSSGYSFHRFQIFAWTIVLGIILVSSVYNNLTMPEFSPTLLGLMGLSAGTYIGFKFPEQK